MSEVAAPQPPPAQSRFVSQFKHTDNLQFSDELSNNILALIDELDRTFTEHANNLEPPSCISSKGQSAMLLVTVIGSAKARNGMPADSILNAVLPEMSRDPQDRFDVAVRAAVWREFVWLREHHSGVLSETVDSVMPLVVKVLNLSAAYLLVQASVIPAFSYFFRISEDNIQLYDGNQAPVLMQAKYKIGKSERPLGKRQKELQICGGIMTHRMLFVSGADALSAEQAMIKYNKLVCE